MPHPRKFRFGLQAVRAPDAAGWRGLAREAEFLGYDVLTMPDHFGDQLAPVPALAAAAAATERLRIGAMVWDNDYKHPVVLAKEIATLDVLSEGRLELGIGAGWMRAEYDHAGLPYDPPGVRIERMAEGLAVIRGLLGEEKFSFSGRHYSVREMDGHPKPVQKPHLPVMIGGGGQRMLKLAAREADIVGVNVDLRGGTIGPEAARNATEEATAEKLRWIREAAGDRFADIELHVLIWVSQIASDRAAALDRLAEEFDAPPDLVAAAPNLLVGSVEEIVATLQERRERWGISYVTFQQDKMREMAPVVERLRGT